MRLGTGLRCQSEKRNKKGDSTGLNPTEIQAQIFKISWNRPIRNAKCFILAYLLGQFPRRKRFKAWGLEIVQY